MLTINYKLFQLEAGGIYLGDRDNNIKALVTAIARLPSIPIDDKPSEEHDVVFVNGVKVVVPWTEHKIKSGDSVHFRKPDDTSPVFGAPRAKIGPRKKNK